MGCAPGLFCNPDNCAKFHAGGAATGFSASSDCCEGVYVSCTEHFNCGRSQFCGTQCWTGDCGFDRSVSAGTVGNYCQPCNKCQNGALDSVTGNCNFCNYKGQCNQDSDCAFGFYCTSKKVCARAQTNYCDKNSCGLGDAGCNPNDEMGCEAGLVCGKDNCGRFHEQTLSTGIPVSSSCCEVPPEPVLCVSDADCAWGNYCTSKKVCAGYLGDYCDTNSCGVGDADCDADDNVGCAAGLTCGEDNCAQFHEIGEGSGFNPSSDCCEGTPLTTKSTTGVPTATTAGV